MTFAELYKPYVNSKTTHPSDIVRWLEREGFSNKVIEKAMEKVKDDLTNGMEFKGDERRPAAWFLWIYVRDVARKLRAEEPNAVIDMLDWRTLSKWKKLKKVIFGEI